MFFKRNISKLYITVIICLKVICGRTNAKKQEVFITLATTYFTL